VSTSWKPIDLIPMVVESIAHPLRSIVSESISNAGLPSLETSLHSSDICAKTSSPSSIKVISNSVCPKGQATLFERPDSSRMSKTAERAAAGHFSFLTPSQRRTGPQSQIAALTQCQRAQSPDRHSLLDEIDAIAAISNAIAAIASKEGIERAPRRPSQGVRFQVGEKGGKEEMTLR
jgi:hypothetical protein